MTRSFFGKCKKVTVSELSDVIGAIIVGDPNRKIEGVATLQNASIDQLSFFINNKYISDLQNTNSAACIMSEEHVKDAPEHVTKLVHNNPYFAYANALNFLYDEDTYSGRNLQLPEPIVGKDTIIEPNSTVKNGAIIGDNCYIGAGVFIGHNVKIGNNTIIDANTTLTHAIIGDNCAIHAGVRIGQEGFGFAHDKAAVVTVKQLGRVVIGNNVHIGANTCIDRGSIEDTIVGDYTRIDNLVQIAHGVQIGMYCVLAAHVAIAGSTKVGAGTMMGGQTGVAGHLRIGAKSRIAAKSGVMRDVPPGQTVGGSPAVPINLWHRQNVILHNMAKSKKEAK